jgi:outer membrane immunogenic protein
MRMRNKALLWITAVTALVFAGGAQAADMPLKAPRAVSIHSDWTGFYLGVHGGYGWGKIKPDDFDVADVTYGVFHNPKPKGWVFGGQAGYLWQHGRLVGGLEIDYSAAGLKENQTRNFEICPIRVLAEFIDNCVDGSIALKSKIDALASARARAGFLVTDNLLAYGTAGIGWGHSTAALVLTIDGDSAALTAKTNNFGWVAGGGLEYQFSHHWRLRGEYLHYDFGSVGYAFQPILTINAKASVDVARGGLSYRF